MDMNIIENWWIRLWNKFPRNVETTSLFLLNNIIAVYESPNRHYHNFAHIWDCLSLLEKYSSLAVHPEEIEMAILLHDIKYDIHRKDNEKLSAYIAKFILAGYGIDKNIIERVYNLIMATTHDSVIEEPDAQLMADIDLARLGSDADVFDMHSDNIRKEYSEVEDEIYYPARLKILKRFIDREHIYYRQEFRDEFEEKARTNLKRAIQELSLKVEK